jgi:hypothetical protein
MEQINYSMCSASKVALWILAIVLLVIIFTDMNPYINLAIIWLSVMYVLLTIIRCDKCEKDKK